MENLFRFYSKPTETCNRVAVVGQFSEGELKVAVARCSTKDNFSRKKGRAIAEGRLTKGRLYDTYKMPVCISADFVELAKVIAHNVAESKEIYS